MFFLIFISLSPFSKSRITLVSTDAYFTLVVECWYATIESASKSSQRKNPFLKTLLFSYYLASVDFGSFKSPTLKRKRKMTGHESAVVAAATAAPPSLVLLNQLGRSFSSLFTQCAAPGHQVIVLSIDDITSGDGEYLLDISSSTSNKKGMSSSLSVHSEMST